MTVGQTNIWRHHVRQATLAALHARTPFSEINPRMEFFQTIRNQVFRATFIAKLDGEEYSRIKR